MLKLHEFTENINKTQYKGKILQHEPLSTRTTMKTGGTAELLLVPQDPQSAIIAIGCLRNEDIPFLILGGGSNVIAPDGELEAAVISTEAWNSISIAEETGDQVLISCGSGTKTDDLVKFCAEKGIRGLETFAGLPGTVGGATYMNARCYGKEIADVIHGASFIDFGDMQKNNDFCNNFIERHLKMYHNDKSGVDWAYKNSPFMHGHYLVTSVLFKAQKADPDAIRQVSQECEKYILDRENKGHFKAPSAGSVFKNDRSFGEPSGSLIDKAGLKGTSIGGAQVAPWHGNIIINQGNATSADIKSLVQKVQETVRQKNGFNLETEILFADQILQ
ncbi:MAG: UDP-N-acetylmuramate dehydrogenase [Treponema sp.]|nr:UDP-N-acetylmuramate dehydrogenase [Candidatus Treponema equi]